MIERVDARAAVGVIVELALEHTQSVVAVTAIDAIGDKAAFDNVVAAAAIDRVAAAAAIGLVSTGAELDQIVAGGAV